MALQTFLENATLNDKRFENCRLMSFDRGHPALEDPVKSTRTSTGPSACIQRSVVSNFLTLVDQRSNQL